MGSSRLLARLGRFVFGFQALGLLLGQPLIGEIVLVAVGDGAAEVEGARRGLSGSLGMRDGGEQAKRRRRGEGHNARHEATLHTMNDRS
jgi:hypothetical protein